MARKFIVFAIAPEVEFHPDGEDISALMAAIADMRNFWRNGNAKGDGKETYSVEMMGACGAVIAEAEKVIDFTEDEDGDDWGDPR